MGALRKVRLSGMRRVDRATWSSAEDDVRFDAKNSLLRCILSFKYLLCCHIASEASGSWHASLLQA